MQTTFTKRIGPGDIRRLYQPAAVVVPGQAPTYLVEIVGVYATEPYLGPLGWVPTADLARMLFPDAS